jgi:chorismate synthase
MLFKATFKELESQSLLVVNPKSQQTLKRRHFVYFSLKTRNASSDNKNGVIGGITNGICIWAVTSRDPTSTG